MAPTKIQNDEDWDGVEQREVRRRYTFDRRTLERRKRYWWSVIFPILLGTILTGLLSWGVYVTHVTYRISANYEETFVKHIEKEIEKEAQLEHKFELIKADHMRSMEAIRLETSKGLAEIRSMQATMYRLLLENARKRNGYKGSELK